MLMNSKKQKAGCRCHSLKDTLGRTSLKSTVIMLLMLLTALLSSESSAQDTLADPSVRLVYFLPKDRRARPERIKALREMIKQVQAFYADEMQRHGYGRKTFRLETDRTGDPIVHRVNGRFNDIYYHRRTTDKVFHIEVWEQFYTPRHVYLCVIDMSQENIHSHASDFVCGVGGSHGDGGGDVTIAFGRCFNFRVVAHELGHAFGLEHDFRKDAYIMSYGGENRDQLSKCAAEWLDAHLVFNSENRECRLEPVNGRDTLVCFWEGWDPKN